jgi:L,D-transpeptidase YbiS
MNRIDIRIKSQELVFYENNIATYFPISTAKNGAGEKNGSNCTPRGRHIVRARIGAGCPKNTVFVGRRPTGEIYSPELAAEFPDRDWILTRILWLSGCEVGFNRLGDVDTMRRYIYIHGTPDTVPMGVPASHGCILLHNDDLIALFDRVATRLHVNIV